MDASSHNHFSLSLLVALFSLLCTIQSWAGSKGQDHPKLDRYPGAKIANYDYKEYEEAVLLLSRPFKKDRAYQADKLLPVEGQVTYIHYELPKSASTLQVFRNYQKSIQRAGGEVLFNCERPCFDFNLGNISDLIAARGLYLNGHKQIQYLAAKLDNTYVSLFVNQMQGTHVWLFVVDKEALDDDKMSPMARGLADNGKIDLYGLLFDTGKATLKPESDQELTELAQVLLTYPQLNMQIVGHTDNVGSEAANLQLSSARAQTVYRTLMRNYGIKPSRLNAVGQGELEPVADNSTAEGRAKNRRVEIVALNPEALTTTHMQTVAHPSQEDKTQQEAENDDVMDKVDAALDVSKKILDLF